MIRFRLYYDKDKETAWLNKMAADGWAMESFFAGFFRFEKCEKGEYAYQVDFGNKFGSVSGDYREFMQEAGIEIVQTWGYWVILRKKAAEGKFELYTDVASSIEHYKKIRRMFKAVTIAELIALFVELYCAVAGGVGIGYVGALLVGAMLLTCLNAVIGLNDTIGRLQERMDGIEQNRRCGRLSPLLAAGLLLNGCAVAMEESISPNIKICVQIAAVILMLTGLFRTCRMKKG